MLFATFTMQPTHHHANVLNGTDAADESVNASGVLEVVKGLALHAVTMRHTRISIILSPQYKQKKLATYDQSVSTVATLLA